MNQQKTRSDELQPGTRLRSSDGTEVTLDRRKSPHDERLATGHFPYHPGWWCRRGGGLADFVIDDPKSPWEIVQSPERMNERIATEVSNVIDGYFGETLERTGRIGCTRIDLVEDLLTAIYEITVSE